MAGEGDVKLLGTVVSPFAVRVRVALHAKGVSYEYLEQDLSYKGELLLLLTSNPVRKKVPVLIHAGRPVRESLTIVEYVDEVWAGVASLLPADPYDRTVTRFWAAYDDGKVLSAWIGNLAYCARSRGRTEPTSSTPVTPRSWWSGQWRMPSPCALVGKTSSPATPSGTSISAQMQFEALREMFGVTDIDAGRTPSLAAWAGRFVQTEAAKKVPPPMESMVENAGKLQAIWAAARRCQVARESFFIRSASNWVLCV